MFALTVRTGTRLVSMSFAMPVRSTVVANAGPMFLVTIPSVNTPAEAPLIETEVADDPLLIACHFAVICGFFTMVVIRELADLIM